MGGLYQGRTYGSNHTLPHSARWVHVLREKGTRATKLGSRGLSQVSQAEIRMRLLGTGWSIVYKFRNAKAMQECRIPCARHAMPISDPACLRNTCAPCLHKGGACCVSSSSHVFMASHDPLHIPHHRVSRSKFCIIFTLHSPRRTTSAEGPGRMPTHLMYLALNPANASGICLPPSP